MGIHRRRKNGQVVTSNEGEPGGRTQVLSLRERILRASIVRGKFENMRQKIPAKLRSSYDQGGEVPFFLVWRAVFLEYPYQDR